MSAIAPLAITYWPRLTQPQGKRAKTTWAKLLARLSVPKVHAVKLDIPGFALATFKDDRRSLANVEQVYALGLDLDEGVRWAEVRDRFSQCASFVHSTWSSTLNEPRARVFLLLSRPVTGAEYRLVYASVAAKAEAGGLVVDRAASDPSRLWFLPAIKHGAPFISYVGDGLAVNVEAAMEAAPKPKPYESKRPLAYTDTPAVVRARKYLAQCDAAVSGSGGHNTTFITASKLVRGFALSVDDAYDLMCEWNQRCQPPWSERELRRKVEQAASTSRMAEGDMLEQRRG